MDAKFRFINSSRFGVAIVKCFGVCPRAGRFSATGYRGITLIAEIDGKPLEVQLMTPYMVMWADWAYDVLLDVSMSLKFQFGYEVPCQAGVSISKDFFLFKEILDIRRKKRKCKIEGNMK